MPYTNAAHVGTLHACSRLQVYISKFVWLTNYRRRMPSFRQDSLLQVLHRNMSWTALFWVVSGIFRHRNSCSPVGLVELHRAKRTINSWLSDTVESTIWYCYFLRQQGWSVLVWKHFLLFPFRFEVTNEHHSFMGFAKTIWFAVSRTWRAQSRKWSLGRFPTVCSRLHWFSVGHVPNHASPIETFCRHDGLFDHFVNMHWIKVQYLQTTCHAALVENVELVKYWRFYYGI